MQQVFLKRQSLQTEEEVPESTEKPVQEWIEEPPSSDRESLVTVTTMTRRTETTPSVR